MMRCLTRVDFCSALDHVTRSLEAPAGSVFTPDGLLRQLLRDFPGGFGSRYCSCSHLFRFVLLGLFAYGVTACYEVPGSPLVADVQDRDYLAFLYVTPVVVPAVLETATSERDASVLVVDPGADGTGVLHQKCVELFFVYAEVLLGFCEKFLPGRIICRKSRDGMECAVRCGIFHLLNEG